MLTEQAQDFLVLANECMNVCVCKCVNPIHTATRIAKCCEQVQLPCYGTV